MGVTKNPLVFVHADDWSGLYIGGKLVTEGHSIEPEEVCSALGVAYKELWANDDWLNELGRLPKLLKDVKF